MKWIDFKVKTAKSNFENIKFKLFYVNCELDLNKIVIYLSKFRFF